MNSLEDQAAQRLDTLERFFADLPIPSWLFGADGSCICSNIAARSVYPHEPPGECIVGVSISEFRPLVARVLAGETIVLRFDPLKAERTQSVTAALFPVRAATGQAMFVGMVLSGDLSAWAGATPKISDFAPRADAAANPSHPDTERRELERTLKATEEALRQAQKMDAIGRLAGGIAHDFNNLLSIILTCTVIVRDGLVPSDPLVSELNAIRAAGERAAAFTRQLLAFSRQQVLAPTVVDLNDIVRDIEQILRRVIPTNIGLRVVMGTLSGRVTVDPVQIEQVIVNLAVNARDAMATGGTLTLETSEVTLDPQLREQHPEVLPGRYVLLSVSDTGHGIDESLQSRIFDPFFTTKERGKGTGLGLSTVLGIVRQSGGYIWVDSKPGHGTIFRIHLPLTEAQPVRPQIISPRASMRGTETILLVDDQQELREVAQNVLRRSGYAVFAFSSGAEALEWCELFLGTVHLLVTDIMMPGMNGMELAAQVASRFPSTKILLMSGYADPALADNGRFELGGAFLQKPITPDLLLRKVRDVLDGRSSARPLPDVPDRG